MATVVSRPKEWNPNRARRRKLLSSWTNNLILLIILFLVLAPILWLVEMSFRTGQALFQMPPPLTSGWTLLNYVSLAQTNFGRNLLNSLIVSTSTTAVAMAFGVPAAYSISRYHFRYENLLTFWILVARLALPIGFALPLFTIFSRIRFFGFGLSNTYPGIVLAYLTFTIPLVIWVLRPFLDGIPVDVEESAVVDGASNWQVFFRIVVPLAAPGMVAVGILTFIVTWIEFFYALIFTRGNMMTAPVGVISFLQYAGWQWEKITAAGVVIMLPVIIFAIFTHRYLVRGLTSGAVKG